MDGMSVIHRLKHQKPVMVKEKGSSGRPRMLVTVNVLGSPGPMRFITGEGEPVSRVIGTTLFSYSREGRYPPLGFDVNEFQLFCQSDFMEPLNPSVLIGVTGCRNFLLCKKQLRTVPRKVTGTRPTTTTQPQPHVPVEKKAGGSGSGGSSSGRVWKAWLYKSLHMKILPY